MEHYTKMEDEELRQTRKLSLTRKVGSEKVHAKSCPSAIMFKKKLESDLKSS